MIDQPLPPFLRQQPDGLLLSVKLQPRAACDEVSEQLGNELKIKVTAPPVDSAANQALVQFLASKLNCSRRQIELIRGHTSHHKTIKISGLSSAEVLKKIFL